MAENQIPDASAGQQLVGTDQPVVQDLSTGDSTPLQNVLTHLENEAPAATTQVPPVVSPVVGDPKPGDERQPTGAITSLP
ncbi:hypothetical protein CFP65_4736 [Kitasatospora sp. MMS16-BH015]|uniref:hypothetical protein n=1 Tax=Kitasatospora sp. MMS16-BH015 TaxID=2018025 RepID=UPI000CA3EA3F|nr:hypothetical protein [Kitasatospora sp. MMS16-BH015]AUG79460.1 hypothetical protein CFP65_4736 [Kitasatospora sp. MMS16-BH015]